MNTAIQSAFLSLGFLGCVGVLSGESANAVVAAGSAVPDTESIAVAVSKMTTEEVAALRPKAKEGDPVAQYQLGELHRLVRDGYRVASDVNGDEKEMLKWMTKAAEQSFAPAEYRVGREEKDVARAIDWLCRAFNHGDKDALGILGSRLRELDGVLDFEAGMSRDWDQIVEAEDNAYLPKSTGGNLFDLPEVGSTNKGTPPTAPAKRRLEPPATVGLYRFAAEQGAACGQYLLAKSYELGFGVQQDLAEAARWYRKAAEQGDLQSMFHLAIAFRSGCGVPADVAESLKYYRESLDEASQLWWACRTVEAARYSWIGMKVMRSVQNEEEVARSVEYVRICASERSEGWAQLAMARLCQCGHGVPHDPAAAVEWFQKALRSGQQEAAYWLALSYAFGDGVERDDGRAVSLLLAAMNQNDGRARDALRWLFAGGENWNYPPRERFKRFRVLAKQGDGDAAFQLSLAYENGDGIPKNSRLSRRWFEESVKLGSPEAQWRESRTRSGRQKLELLESAALHGHAAAQSDLSGIYESGRGVPKDELEALAWAYVFSGNEQPSFTQTPQEAEAMRQRLSCLEARVGRQGALMAQQRSKEIYAEIRPYRPGKSGTRGEASPVPTQPKSSGTGAIVSAAGHILTAAHVVAGASRVTVVTSRGEREAQVVRIDEQNDLAVLQIGGSGLAPLPLVSSRRMRLGQAVATIGFPNITVQGFSPKITRGEISSLNGLADDPRCWQISVPVQPGNSGGPLLDESGNVVGVVVSKLGLKAAAALGDIPQNVNYAVKSAYAIALLDAYVEAKEGQLRDGKASFEDMVNRAQQSVVLILVY